MIRSTGQVPGEGVPEPARVVPLGPRGAVHSNGPGPNTERLQQSREPVGREPLPSALDADARRYIFLIQGTEFPAAEAAVFSPDFGVTIFSFSDIGYVTDDDWDEVDPEELLKGIGEATEDSNEDRVKNGYDAVHVKGWATEPQYDVGRKIAFWAIELQTDKGQTNINSIALKLGRYGVMEILLIVPPEIFAGSSANLETMLATHTYDDGHGYAEYQDGDKVAALSLAALVAAAAGAKLGKGGLLALLAVLVVFLKKGWVVIAVVIGGVWTWQRHRKKQA